MTPPPQDLIRAESQSPLPPPSPPIDFSSQEVEIASERAGSMLVRKDLLRFGPQHFPMPSLLPNSVRERWSPSSCSLAESQAYCREVASTHYENFSVVSHLVPQRLRQDVANIYAYCRWTDDLADEMDSPAQSQYLLDWWSGLLQDCFQGNVSHPVYVALHATIAKHGLTREPFEALIHAFVQDQTKTRYETDEELDRYCEGSANPVGRLLLALANVRDDESRRASDAICTGLQLANFCQDILLDASRDRIYLPQQRWTRYGLVERDILSGTFSKSLRDALLDWCQRAEQKLIDGLPLVRRVPFWLARNVQLFARGGLALLHEIEKANYDVWSRTIEVKRSTKIRLLFRGWLQPRSTYVKRLRGN